MRARRLVLRRGEDGRVYLNRWGVNFRFGGVYLHVMSAPDPGEDLHDHPWWFVTLPLWGGYCEERADIRDAPYRASRAHAYGGARGRYEVVRPWRPKTMRLDECHRIIDLRRRHAVSLVVHGPLRRRWGFYAPNWVDSRTYDATRARPLAEYKR